MLGDTGLTPQEDDRVLDTLSNISTRVIKELQNGSISGVTFFNADDFTGILSIAAGGRGEIFKAFLRRDTIVAVKVFDHQFAVDSTKFSEREAKLRKYFIRECGMWKSVDSHPNVVSILGFIESFQHYTLPAIVTEYYDFLDLRRYVDETRPVVTIKVRLKFLIDACSGLRYVHSKFICHRDIKASNILLKSQGGVLTAAIGDFGSAKLEDPDIFSITKSTVKTSLAWTPPEYVSEQGVDYSSPTAAGDIWSFGCTILEVLTGDDPWPPFANIKRHLLEGQHPPRPDGIPDGAWEILGFCWDSKPSKRKPAFVIEHLLQSQLHT